MSAIMKGADSSLNIGAGRVALNIGKQPGPQVTLSNGAGGSGHKAGFDQPRVRHQQWVLNACFAAGVRQFTEATGPKPDGGRIAPVAPWQATLGHGHWRLLWRLRLPGSAKRALHDRALMLTQCGLAPSGRCSGRQGQHLR